MKFERSFEIAAPRDEVWKFITAPEKVTTCMPGCDGVEEIAENKHRAQFAVKVGPIKTKFNLTVENVEMRGPEYARYLTQGEEGGRASKLRADISLHLRAINDEATEVSYVNEVTITGRLGKFGFGVMKKKADEITDEFVAGLSQELVQGEPVAQPGTPVPTPTIQNRLGMRMSSIVAWIRNAFRKSRA